MNLESALLEIERLQREIRKVVEDSDHSRRKLNDMHKKYSALDREFVVSEKRNLHLEALVAQRPVDFLTYQRILDRKEADIASWISAYEQEKHAVNRLSNRLLEIQKRAIKE